MNYSLSYMINKLLILIFLTFPFWEIITAQFSYFFHVPLVFISAIKYYILTILIILLSIGLPRKRFIINRDALLVMIYVIYTSLHFIGSSHFLLKIDGFRYEVLFPMISFLLLSQQSLKVINFEILIRIIYVQGFVVFFVAFYEYFNQEILTLLYRKSLDEIPHIDWCSFHRLISTVGNPINLGASLIIWIISLFYFMEKSKLLKYSLPIVVSMTFFLVIMTLSRTSLITLAVVVVFFIIMTKVNNVKNIVYTIGVIGLLLLLLNYIIQTSNIDLIAQRFANLFNSNEYLKNERTTNWAYAFSTFEHFEYLWGKGLGTSTPDYEKAKLYDGLTIENGFISIIVNYGIIGFILFCIIFIRFYVLSFFILKNNNKSLGIFLILFLITYSLFNLANDYNRNLPYVLYFWIFYYYAEMIYKSYAKGSNCDIRKNDIQNTYINNG